MASVNLPPTTWYVSLASSDNLNSRTGSSSPRLTDKRGVDAPTAATASSVEAHPMLVAAPNGTVIGVHPAQSAPGFGEGRILACRYLAMPKSARPADCEQTLNDDELNAIISHCKTKLYACSRLNATGVLSCDTNLSDHFMRDTGEVRILSVSDVATSPSLAQLRPSSSPARRARS